MSATSELSGGDGGHKLPFDPDSPLVATGNLARRARVSRGLELLATAAALFAVAVLGLVIIEVVKQGGSVISFHFLTSDPNEVNPALGGIANAIIGTLIIVALATVIAMPLGVLVALYLIEYAGPRTGRIVRTALDLMNGLPTVVVALMVYGLIVLGTHQESAYAASVALAIIMLPLIARSSHSVLLLVPRSLHEAADALGVSRWQRIIGVVIPSSLGGIVTATILAAGRAAGESAPLIILSSLVIGQTVHVNPLQALQGMPYTIFSDFDQGGAYAAQAWGTALVLMVMILAANVFARVFLARNRRKLGL